MNYKYAFLIGAAIVAFGVLIPFQIYKIRKRRQAEQELSHDNHNHGDDHDCCSCH